MNPSFRFAIVCFHFVAFVFCVVGSEDIVHDANEYVDKVLNEIRLSPSIMAKLDPLQLPNFEEGMFKARNGVVTGLASVYRYGDCVVEEKNGNYNLTAVLAARDVTLSAEYKAGAFFLWIRGKMQASLDHLTIKMKMLMKDGHGHLQSFEVIQFGNYKITKISGLSVLFNWLLKSIANSIASQSRSRITKAVEKGFSVAFDDLLEKFDTWAVDRISPFKPHHQVANI